jgi:hypothetical protein
MKDSGINHILYLALPLLHPKRTSEDEQRPPLRLGGTRHDLQYCVILVSYLGLKFFSEYSVLPSCSGPPSDTIGSGGKVDDCTITDVPRVHSRRRYSRTKCQNQPLIIIRRRTVADSEMTEKKNLGGISAQNEDRGLTFRMRFSGTQVEKIFNDRVLKRTTDPPESCRRWTGEKAISVR